jgi:hypothetical protein
LHTPLLMPVAVRYWARTMRSPMGELCFAAHSRHAGAEMRALGDDMAARITDSPALTELLRPPAAPALSRKLTTDNRTSGPRVRGELLDGPGIYRR